MTTPTTTRRGFFGMIAAAIAAIGIGRAAAEAAAPAAPPPGCIAPGTPVVCAGDVLWWLNDDYLRVHVAGAEEPVEYGFMDADGEWHFGVYHPQPSARDLPVVLTRERQIAGLR